MGLIGDKCVTCSAAAKNDKGLAGGWWRFWAKVRDLHVLTEHVLTQAATGKRQLGLYRRWHRRKFCVGRWRAVRGTVGILQVEKG
jgi:hypothetical protein